MRGKRLPPKEPVDDVFRPTKTHLFNKDDYTVVLVKCSPCGQRLPDLVRYDAGGLSDLWIISDIEGPWRAWDGDILRSTTAHLNERHQRREFARTGTQIGLRKRVQESLADHTPGGR